MVTGRFDGSSNSTQIIDTHGVIVIASNRILSPLRSRLDIREQIAEREAQRPRESDEGEQAWIADTPLDVGDVVPRQLRGHGEVTLAQLPLFPKATDRSPECFQPLAVGGLHSSEVSTIVGDY